MCLWTPPTSTGFYNKGKSLDQSKNGTGLVKVITSCGQLKELVQCQKYLWNTAVSATASAQVPHGWKTTNQQYRLTDSHTSPKQNNIMNHSESDFCTQYSKSFVKYWVPWLDQPWEYIFFSLTLFLQFILLLLVSHMGNSCHVPQKCQLQHMCCPLYWTIPAVTGICMEFGEGCIFQSVCVCVCWGKLLWSPVMYECILWSRSPGL